MQQATFVSRLRYLDASDLDNSIVDFDRMDVRGSDGDKLGEVDGFLVDPAARRVLYTVVDSGGWFSSRRLLLPVGHATIDRDSRALQLDVNRQTLSTYPEFDPGRFNELSDEEFRAYQGRMASVCCPDEPQAGTSTTWHDERHYRPPTWWPASGYASDRLRAVEAGSFRDRTVRPSIGRPAVRESYDRELVTARDPSDRDETGSRRGPDDVSPHVGGRAQPGDVLGIETGGETTGIGDTVEDEDERRRGR